MDLTMFKNEASGTLVPISDVDAVRGEWSHRAFVPAPLPVDWPHLTPQTFAAVADARAALAALNSTAQRLPNPTLLRTPTLRREAQSTSALEGTYAPLGEVLTADEDTAPTGSDLREILNYVRMANHAFSATAEGRSLSTALLGELQAILVAGTKSEGVHSGAIRTIQVVIGRRSDAGPGELPVKAARFVPPPNGPELEAAVLDLLRWMQGTSARTLDPVVATAMAHYQFETLHPFHDGNGRLGRLLIIVQLVGLGVLAEPTLTVSPWFEARRSEYYDRLLAVSTEGAWDPFVQFFARGLEASAELTHRQMLALVAAQGELRLIVSSSRLRSQSAQALIDVAVANPSFTVRQAQRLLGLSYARTNSLIAQLVELQVLQPLGDTDYNRRFHAPKVLDVLLELR